MAIVNMRAIEMARETTRNRRFTLSTGTSIAAEGWY